MRDFEQRKAEIFRRSEEKIIENKRKQKRIVSVCIPALACICLVFAYGYSGLNQQKAHPEGEKSFFETLAESFATGPSKEEANDEDIQAEHLTKVEVSGGTLFVVHDDADAVAWIEEKIDEILSHVEIFEATSSESTDMSVMGYTVAITDGEGERSEFCLLENTLTDHSTGKAYLLTPQELEELTIALGIPGN